MPLKFWDQAFLTATYLINILPSRVLENKTPVELLLKEKPQYTSLRVFGCACWPNLRPYNTRKLAFRSTQCVFLGYSAHHKGFKCLEPKTGRIYVSRDVVFDESVFPFSSLHPNAGARLRSDISLLPETISPFIPGDVNCHASNATNTAVPSNSSHEQEQPGVQEVHEISDIDAMDQGDTEHPGANPEDDLVLPIEASSEVSGGNLGSPRGGGQDRLRELCPLHRARRPLDLQVWQLPTTCAKMKLIQALLVIQFCCVHTQDFRATLSNPRYTQMAQ